MKICAKKNSNSDAQTLENATRGNFTKSSPRTFSRRLIRGRHGGVEKGGGWKTSRMTPLPKRGFGPPLVRYVFHPPQASVLCFPVQKSTTEQTRSSFGGVQKFSGERVLWYVFLPPYVLHPPISRPKLKSSPCRKRSPAKGVCQKRDEKSDRSVRKSDQKVTKRVPKTKKVIELLLPTSFCRPPQEHVVKKGGDKWGGEERKGGRSGDRAYLVQP